MSQPNSQSMNNYSNITPHRPIQTIAANTDQKKKL